MELSKIDPAFDDLKTDGIRGAHHSGVYLLFPVKPYLRVGFETVVGNSDDAARTTMDFQSAAGTAEFHYGKKVFGLGGANLGGVIADVLQRDQDASDSKVQTGTHYKSSGFFLAPYAGIGLKTARSREIALFVKYLFFFSGDGADKLDGFSSAYLGLSLSTGI